MDGKGKLGDDEVFEGLGGGRWKVMENWVNWVNVKFTSPFACLMHPPIIHMLHIQTT